MALTPSTMLALGTPCPEFSLPDTATGRTVSRGEFSGRPLLVMFICNHCPFAKHVAPELSRLGRDYAGKAGVVAISSNDAAQFPADAPALMKEEAALWGYPFPYLHDASQSVAKAFSAACTPDFFLFDAAHRLAYRGQLDETRPTRISSGVYAHESMPHGRDLRTALDAVVAGRAAPEAQLPSIGCNIKWK